jgi:predicted O-methyltransferase YrrM
MKQIFEMAGRIKGFLDLDEGRRLYEVGLQAAVRGPCLEVGSYCGKSALFLGSACRHSGTVLFSIDHHRGSEEQQPGEEYFDPELFDVRSHTIDTLSYLRRTLQAAGLEESVVPVVCPSDVAAKAWATPLALVFIDGGHAYETVLSDYTCWSRHIMPEGYLLIHDIFTDPAEGGQAPYRIYQAAIDSGRFRALPMTKTLGVLQRKSCP